MKKLGDIWSEYRDYTSDFTQHSRTLGFAGAGVCWLFKSDGFRFPVLIYLALLSFVSYFSLDLIQMFVAALSRRVYADGQEKKILRSGVALNSEIKVPFPLWIDAAPFCFFILKGIALACGFAFVACELLKRIIQAA